MMKIIKWFLLIIVLFFLVYWMGPHPTKPIYSTSIPAVPSFSQLDEFIDSKEKQHHLKKNNEARIVWVNDTAKQKTAYSIVYLHGFSASQEEGNPVHRNIAKSFGCNLFLSRLSQHGIDTVDQLINLTPDNYWESAKEALAIGRQLGEKTILMGTSTGGSLALQLAAVFPEQVAAVILFSPNIRIKDEKAWLLNNPWGLQIARLVLKGNDFDPADPRPIYKEYWNKPYRLEATVSLQELLETAMVEETFKKVNQPVLMLYYYKDEKNQDLVVSVPAMKKMFEQLSTPANLKRAIAIPGANHHAIATPICSNDVQSVEMETKKFFEQILKLKHL